MQNQQFNGISSSAVTPQINYQNILGQLLTALAVNAQKEQLVKQLGNNEQIQQLISAFNETNKQNNNAVSDANTPAVNPFDLFNQENPGFFEKSARGDVLNYIKDLDMDKDEISKIAKMIEALENSAIEGYLKQSAHDKTINDENLAAKSKLTSYAQNASLDSNNNKVFTREEIGKMSGDEFVKNEKLIMEQVRQGLIK
ncbi:hypothetical protein J6O86_03560 [bacterium]|jgi:hypothetical protein|nr:hypothetical protein [bacterium]